MRRLILLPTALLAACGATPPEAPAPPTAPATAAAVPVAPAPPKQIPELTPPSLPIPDAAAVTAACEAAWQAHGPAIEAALKAKALKMAMPFKTGQRVKDIRGLVGNCPEPIQPATNLAEIAGELCAKDPVAAARITEAAVRLGTVASLCAGDDVTAPALSAVAEGLKAAATAGCPVAAQGTQTGALATIQAAPTLKHVPDARAELEAALSESP